MVMRFPIWNKLSLYLIALGTFFFFEFPSHCLNLYKLPVIVDQWSLRVLFSPGLLSPQCLQSQYWDKILNHERRYFMLLKCQKKEKTPYSVFIFYIEKACTPLLKQRHFGGVSHFLHKPGRGLWSIKFHSNTAGKSKSRNDCVHCSPCPRPRRVTRDTPSTRRCAPHPQRQPGAALKPLWQH